MEIHMQEYLEQSLEADSPLRVQPLQLPRVSLEPESIRVIMINEAPPKDPRDSFYSGAPSSADLESALSLLQRAGLSVNSMAEVLGRGVYLTTALKTAKEAYAVATPEIRRHLPLLERELTLFANLRAVMCMGDVAIKAVNLLARQRGGAAVIPAVSTYKLRREEFYWDALRVFPSYIMTGGNLRIEKSKSGMIVEDIERMLPLLDR